MNSSRSVHELTRDAVLHLGDLVRNEVRLARAEVFDGVRGFAAAGVRLVIGAVFAMGAVTLALFALAAALSEALPVWAGALISALVGAIAAYVLIRSGRTALTRLTMPLKRTTENVSRDVETIKETITL